MRNNNERPTIEALVKQQLDPALFPLDGYAEALEEAMCDHLCTEAFANNATDWREARVNHLFRLLRFLRSLQPYFNE